MIRRIISLFRESSNRFEGKEPEEEVLLVLRRHPIGVILRLVVLTLFAFAGLALFVVLEGFIVLNNLFGFALFALGLYYLALWQMAFYILTMHALDVWIVTSRRVVDSTQRGFFNRTVSELNIARIQDVTLQMSGFGASLFNFGDLEIQTAGAETKFRFRQIKNPEKVKDLLMSLVDARI